VGEGVVADLLTLPIHLADDVGVFGHLLADHEEGGLDVVTLQHVEDARRPDRIGPVVEGERDLMRGRAAALDQPTGRIDLIVLVRNQAIGGIDVIGSGARLRIADHLQQLAFADESDGV